MRKDVYDGLGVKKRINAAGLVTRLGGSLMSNEVLDAMREAAAHYVDIGELQTRASAVIARHTGAEAGIVTSGAAAALTMATAACLTRHDVVKMERLPDTEGIPNEVIMYRVHRTGYDHAIRAAGARIREIGFNDPDAGAGVRGPEDWEIEAAVTANTVAIAYTVTPSGQPPLRRVVKIANRLDLPVIVDAAAQLPPKENLRRFVDEGAALVAFSGGKAIRGPQGTGILCGRRELVSAALVQQLDMDVAPETWDPPRELLSPDLVERFPHHGLGRGFKVDKESIIGLVVALERFARSDIDAEIKAKEGQLARLVEALKGANHAKTTLAWSKGNARYPVLEILLDERALKMTAFEFSRRLHKNLPPVHLSERRGHEGILVVDPAGLRPGDEQIVARALSALLRPRRK